MSQHRCAQSGFVVWAPEHVWQHALTGTGRFWMHCAQLEARTGGIKLSQPSHCTLSLQEGMGMCWHPTSAL